VHVVTLQQTHFNCPHWYTEGLAVRSEAAPRPKAWNDLLRDRVPNGKVFNLRTLNFGFTRPHSSDDGQLAYCQAELYVQYMIGRGGEPSLQRLLTAYGDGLTDPEAIQRVFAVSQVEFERGYTAFLKQEVAKLAAVRKPAEEEADQLSAQRKAARAALQRKDFAAAETAAREAIEFNVMDAELHRLLAESLSGRHNDAEATEEYEVARELDRMKEPPPP
jgi:cellulose synthase operon protein C